MGRLGQCWLEDRGLDASPGADADSLRFWSGMMLFVDVLWVRSWSMVVSGNAVSGGASGRCGFWLLPWFDGAWVSVVVCGARGSLLFPGSLLVPGLLFDDVVPGLWCLVDSWFLGCLWCLGCC